MVQLPLNAVCEVSNFLIERLQCKPNWRREEVIEELEGALNDWVKKHNLVVAPMDLRVDCDGVHVTTYYEEAFPWEVERWLAEPARERERAELARLSVPVPP